MILFTDLPLLVTSDVLEYTCIDRTVSAPSNDPGTLVLPQKPLFLCNPGSQKPQGPSYISLAPSLFLDNYSPLEHSCQSKLLDSPSEEDTIYVHASTCMGIC